jgi:hypothetical protein
MQPIISLTIKAHSPVGGAEGCDLLILLFCNQDQTIAAFGSSYSKDKAAQSGS